ncbi:hypothetical protein BKA57DRAFT_449421 [Linnemannia elongata]|nr:hypothetical protein BKA57DRAFT_449421 [Linnemannia elongata]
MFFSLYPRCVFHFYLSCCFVFALERIASHTFFLFLLPAALVVDFGCLCFFAPLVMALVLSLPPFFTPLSLFA